MSRERRLQLSALRTSQLNDPKAIALHEIHDYFSLSLKSIFQNDHAEQELAEDIHDFADQKVRESTDDAETTWNTSTASESYMDSERYSLQSYKNYAEILRIANETLDMILTELEEQQDVSAEVAMVGEKLKIFRRRCGINITMSERTLRSLTQ